MASTIGFDSSGAPVPAVPCADAAEIEARAELLLPLLRSQQRKNAECGQVSETLHEQFLKAGFYRILQPLCFGGLELDYLSFARVILIVARGDPAVAVVLAQTAAQAALLASYWPKCVQEEVFGAAVDLVAAHATAPAGHCQPVDGGYLVEGLWTNCAGVAHSTHFIAASVLRSPDGRRYCARFVLDRVHYADVPKEHFSSRRTIQGRTSVKVSRQFLPAERVVLFDEHAHNSYTAPPGLGVHPNPMYIASGAVLAHAAAVSPMLGAALAALDEFRAIMLSRRTDFAVGQRSERTIQRTLGRAVVLAEGAEALLERALQSHLAHCVDWQRTGIPTQGEASMRVWGMLDSAGRLAGEAVDTLYMNGGALPVDNDRRMQRYLRNVQTQSELHMHLQDDVLTRIGKAELESNRRLSTHGRPR